MRLIGVAAYLLRQQIEAFAYGELDRDLRELGFSVEPRRAHMEIVQRRLGTHAQGTVQAIGRVMHRGQQLIGRTGDDASAPIITVLAGRDEFDHVIVFLARIVGHGTGCELRLKRLLQVGMLSIQGEVGRAVGVFQQLLPCLATGAKYLGLGFFARWGRRRWCIGDTTGKTVSDGNEPTLP